MVILTAYRFFVFDYLFYFTGSPAAGLLFFRQLLLHCSTIGMPNHCVHAVVRAQRKVSKGSSRTSIYFAAFVHPPHQSRPRLNWYSSATAPALLPSECRITESMRSCVFQKIVVVPTTHSCRVATQTHFMCDCHQFSPEKYRKVFLHSGAAAG